MKCKIDGCPKDAAAKVGRYAGLCSTHADEAKSKPTPAGGNSNGLAGRVSALVPIARRLDRARARASTAPQVEQAQERLNEAMRLAQTDPIEANLDRVAEALKEVRKSAPRRRKALDQLEETEREFKTELAKVMRALGVAAAH